MEYIIVSDLHFGLKNNNLTWLNRQLKVFEDQIIPLAMQLREEYGEVAMINCGDTFESKSSLNPMVVYKVDELFKRLSEVFNNIYTIAGNHDMYMTTEDAVYNISSVDLLHPAPNHHIYVNDIYADEEHKIIFVPWFCWLNHDKMQDVVDSFGGRSFTIFTHTDLQQCRYDAFYNNILNNFDVFSGHVHTPWQDRDSEHRWVTLGSLYPQTFADANQDRYFWVWDSGLSDYTYHNHIYKHPNESCIKFWRFRNEQMLKAIGNYDIGPDDYIELYLDQNNIDRHEYVEAVKEFNRRWSKNCNMYPTDTTDLSDSDQNNIDPLNYNIQTICEQNIPEKLMDKFRKIIGSVL